MPPPGHCFVTPKYEYEGARQLLPSPHHPRQLKMCVCWYDILPALGNSAQEMAAPLYLLAGDERGYLSVLPARTDSKFFAIDVWETSLRHQVLLLLCCAHCLLCCLGYGLLMNLLALRFVVQVCCRTSLDVNRRYFQGREHKVYILLSVHTRQCLTCIMYLFNFS